MDNRAEVRDFLATRRARLTPALVYTAEPGTPRADALQVLSSWAATPQTSPVARS